MMRTKRRWMQWIFEEADANTVPMPWERQQRRTGWTHQLAETAQELELEDA